MRHHQTHIAGWRAVLLAPIFVPLIAAIKAAQWLFGSRSTADLTAADVRDYLTDLLNDTGGEWDWDDFTCIPITDPHLEEIRVTAAAIPLPLTDYGRGTIETLLRQVRDVNDH